MRRFPGTAMLVTVLALARLLAGQEAGTLSLGTECTAMLRVQNVGKESVQLPWWLDPQLLEQPDQEGKYEYFHVSLLLTISQGRSPSHFFLPVRLYGSKSNPDSLVEVKSGEWLQLRTKIPLNCDGALFGCKELLSGPANVNFAWNESRNTVAYQKCSIASGSERGRYLTSEVLVRDIDASRVRP